MTTDTEKAWSVDDIAAALSVKDGRAWRVLRDADRDTITNDAGEKVTLRLDWRDKSKLYARGLYPVAFSGGDLKGLIYPKDAVQDDSAGVSVSRGAVTIAAEIVRRVLPGYRANMIEGKKRDDSHRADAHRRECARANIEAAAMRRELPRWKPTREHSGATAIHIADAEFTITCDDDRPGGVRVRVDRLDLSESLALRLLALMAEAEAEKLPDDDEDE